ncbi:MAG: nucleotide sugar dehydrogenase [Acidobacteriota bacterium]|nr:nucleotide sugar dehydrogenase [Acidobacteriota bacterium]
MPPGFIFERIRKKTARAGVIGLGYVGLPLLVEFAKAGFDVIGFDVDQGRVDAVGRGESYVEDVPADDLRKVVAAGRLRTTTGFDELSSLDTVNICVPTPLRKTKDPDLSFVVAAVNEIARHLRSGQLIILESTTYPGTVEEVVKPQLEATGLLAGKDFFLAFSPERVDPGNVEWPTSRIPKVVGGIDEDSTRLAMALYEQFIETVVPVSSARVAEMVKLLENTFRAVNIGLANEFALMCRDLGVDVWEVIEAAETKPFGFMPFYPGPGLGGHCVPIDPFYLSWKARQVGFESRFIELAGHINGGMPRHVVQRISDALNSQSKAINGSVVHLFGVAYKPGVSDTRESPALDILQLLLERGAVVRYTDPYVGVVTTGDVKLEAMALEEALAGGIDCAVITTAHSQIDYAEIARRVPVVVDTRNALKRVKADHVFRL